MDLKTSDILERLKAEVPSVATAAILVAYADTADALRKSLLEWAREADRDHTHIAVRLISGFEDGGIGSLAMTVRRLPRFHPGLLGSESKAFYNICPLCGQPHHGTVNPVVRSIVLECPKCDQQYDLLSVDLKGRYHRVTSFLNGPAPLAAELPLPGDTRDREEEVFAIWEGVLEHCRYVTDFAGINGRRDAWQFADETERYRNGDCEDTAILLADRLLSRGFDARVALGRTERFEGHAWCVVRVGGTEYILETTEIKPDRSLPPTTKRLGSHYIPEFLFDRGAIYFRAATPWSGTYWSEGDWVRVGYPLERADALAAAPAGN